jgi:uncharacterized protein YbaR (Trm112 family)
MEDDGEWCLRRRPDILAGSPLVTRRTSAANLYDLLACPTCKVSLARIEDRLTCAACGGTYPIIDGVPILFPDGRIPEYQHQHELHVRTGYNPWIERVVMQSLPAGAIVLDLGAGNRSFNLPHVIRMDVTRTPFVDVVGDAHAMPFVPGTFDFIFSLAVIEHLRQPFLAAEEMSESLRPGGYVYGECNFIFPYHGFPHHYFNASQQGLEQVFAPFTRLRSGVAPYQMPSFAVRNVLTTYREALERLAGPFTGDLRALLDSVCRQPLGACDQFFSEAEALRLAAGVFFFGVRAPDGVSEVIPEPVQEAWHGSAALRRIFPNLLDLGHAQNIMHWAKSTGRTEHPAIERWFSEATPFRKSANVDDVDWTSFQSEPILEPAFGHISATDEDRAASPEKRTIIPGARFNRVLRKLRARVSRFLQ